MASLFQPLKVWARTISHRVRFPHAQIGAACLLSEGCDLAPGVIVGRECQVFESRLAEGTVLGERVVIGHGTATAHSTLGRGCVLERDVELFNSTVAEFVSVQTKCVLNRIRIGRYSYIGRETNLNEVTIGSFASIGPRTLLGFGEHPSNLTSTSPVFYSTRRQCGTTFAQGDHFVERKPIILGHDVWLGARVFVRDGVTIGDGAIVAAGSVVTKDVPPYAIVGGVPAKFIRARYAEDVVRRLLALQWWQWDEARLRAGQPKFAQPDIHEFLRWAEA